MFSKKYKQLIFTVFSLFYSSFIFAQVMVMPIDRSANQRRQASAVAKDSVAAIHLNLPFFDDFSAYLGAPDTLRWMGGSGVRINNTLGIAPPTMGVASFDGAKADGTPYDISGLNGIGLTDQLTSLSFDVEALTPDDSLTLSFFWQLEGLGEMPDVQTDSLVLKVRLKNLSWKTLWKSPLKIGETFLRQPTNILLNDTVFLHQDLQFRFEAYGRQSGVYDTWHLDYVHLYTRKNDKPTLRRDVAMALQPTSLLKKYTAMPYAQFIANPAAEWRDTLETSVHNLSDIFNVYVPHVQINDLSQNKKIADLATIAISENGENRSSGAAFIGSRERMRLLAVNPPLSFDNQIDSLHLETTFWIDSIETNQIIRTRTNDTIRIRTVLNDYYAYDDGSAEYVIGLVGQGGKGYQMAYRYALNQPDTLIGIDVCFVRLGSDLTGNTFNLMVWDKIDTLTAKNSLLRLRRNVNFVYPSQVNGFQRLATGKIAVKDTLFIGYEELTDKHLTLGYDKNTASGEHIFYNIDGTWRQNTQFGGSMMLRPVFQKKTQNPLAVPQNPLPHLKIYPNPAQDYLFVEGDVVETVSIFDLLGNKMLEENISQKAQKVLNISFLPSGFYLAKLQNQLGQSAVLRLLIAR